MRKFILLAALALGLSACTDPETAQRVLRQQGYSDIVITGHEWFGCSNSDDYSTGFRAKSPAGINVEGVFCSSYWGKGGTIRFY
ncbi:hypothetical protein SAMN05216548_11485 [Faunimonas pinastri]|uniref:Lipoprotein n=1 Tax=Faunimonas pinastri TaxID=1855383 RepID=A0A1H9MWQ7_9HYPH|nr:hypothetical protein [Faunimonas pinastri]SER28134.1 hypothetical protein SAMN05216548_11485 [Faunimonas pinastri]